MTNHLDNLKIEIFGESHGECVGVSVKGLPIGLKLDFDLINEYLDRRRASDGEFSTARKEEDIPIFTEGVENGIITGKKVTVVTYNKNQISKHYDDLTSVPRPSHADYGAIMKFGKNVDLRGGGKFSGRLTFGLVVIGAIAKQLLREKGIECYSYIASIGKIKGSSYKDKIPTREQLNLLDGNFRVLDNKENILEVIREAKRDKDSVGGVIESIALGITAGLGDTLFDSVESKMSALLFAVPAVKGVEFGWGFDISEMNGSIANDQYYYNEEHKAKTYTNHNGGILGGITNGMPILMRTAIKPTPSIAKEQNSININEKQNVKLSIIGRHDACIVPRATVCIEAVMNIVILDLNMETKND